MLVSYQKHLSPSIYISNFHAKAYQKLLTYPKIWNAFLKVENYQEIRKFRDYRQKLVDT